MYACYTRTRVGTNGTRYQFQERASLFGCNKGFIPWLLGLKLPQDQDEPCKWHVDVIAELDRQSNYAGTTLLIDLKPKQKESNLSLYEVMDVWGYSDHGWTPILLRLNALFVDQDPPTVNSKDFIRLDDEVDRPIYEFLYLDGSIKAGKIVGRWVPPPASPTNAALLWPEALGYFFQCIRDTTPNVFQV